MFYLVQVEEYANGGPRGCNLFQYGSVDGAVAAFHGSMAAAMAAPNVMSELLVVLDDDGGVCRIEKWDGVTEE